MGTGSVSASGVPLSVGDLPAGGSTTVKLNLASSTTFGAGASGTVFGARGSATLFSKLTAVLATLFFVTSMSLAWFATRPRADAPKSIVDTAVTEPASSDGVDPGAVPELPQAPPSQSPAPAEQ